MSYWMSPFVISAADVGVVELGGSSVQISFVSPTFLQMNKLIASIRKQDYNVRMTHCSARLIIVPVMRPLKLVVWIICNFWSSSCLRRVISHSVRSQRWRKSGNGFWEKIVEHRQLIIPVLLMVRLNIVLKVMPVHSDSNSLIWTSGEC